MTALRLRTAVTTGRAVPMYVHPSLDPDGWQQLAAARFGTGFVVVNAADGPGTGPDPAYAAPLAALHAAGTPLLGYVDLGYGECRPEDVLADVLAWRREYGVRGIFADRVPAGGTPAADSFVTRTVAVARARGADRVVLNPGVLPSAVVADAGDAVVTFEGPWRAYHRLPPVHPELAPERVVHLVHSLPPAVPVHAVTALAARTGAGVVGVSRLAPPNPWAVAAAGPLL